MIGSKSDIAHYIKKVSIFVQAPLLRASKLNKHRGHLSEEIHPCRNVISIKLLWNFIEITLRHGCSPVSEHLFL